MRTRKTPWAAVAVVTLMGSMLLTGGVAAGAASSPADQGVTKTTITVGLPYVDFALLVDLGVNINDGSFPDAYTAVADAINAAGGIDGRKIDMKMVSMDPAEPASEDSSCTQLTEDDHVFVSISPVFPDCYQTTHDTPVIAGSLPGALPAGAAPDFSFSPPDTPFDAVQLAAFDKAGVFKGKKVGIFYGATSDAPEVAAVQADLKKLHIPVVLTAEDSAVSTDTVASDQDTQTIETRFQNAGINLVIGVGGSGSTTWPRAQLDLQSTYKPLFIATSESSLISYVQSTKGANPYLDNVLAASSVPTAYQEWQDPAIKKCADEVHKAFPSDTFTAPVNPATTVQGNDTRFQSVIEACQYLSLFQKIADNAGKDLTVASFTKAGDALKDADIPGIGTISMVPGQQYAIGPVTIYHYDTKTQTLVPDTSLK
jgi:Periplasmic binding protein